MIDKIILKALRDKIKSRNTSYKNNSIDQSRLYLVYFLKQITHFCTRTYKINFFLHDRHKFLYYYKTHCILYFVLPSGRENQFF